MGPAISTVVRYELSWPPKRNGHRRVRRGDGAPKPPFKCPSRERASPRRHDALRLGLWQAANGQRDPRALHELSKATQKMNGDETTCCCVRASSGGVSAAASRSSLHTWGPAAFPRRRTTPHVSRDQAARMDAPAPSASVTAVERTPSNRGASRRRVVVPRSSPRPAASTARRVQARARHAGGTDGCRGDRAGVSAAPHAAARSTRAGGADRRGSAGVLVGLWFVGLCRVGGGRRSSARWRAHVADEAPERGRVGLPAGALRCHLFHAGRRRGRTRRRRSSRRARRELSVHR